MSISVVILAGGSGTRLWPLSRAKRPKQFLSINGNETLLQQTVLRLGGLNIDSITIITNKEHRFFVSEQLKEINKDCKIILEPVGKNTAPAISLAALYLDKDSIMLVLSADHMIAKEDEFKNRINQAIQSAKNDQLVTFGIVPTESHIGYGYIKKGIAKEIGFEVDSFYEKPSASKADDYVQSGDYLWNSGMFMFKACKYLEELKLFRKDIYDICKESMQSLKEDQEFIFIDKEVFKKCPSESIDYAVMEHTNNAIVLPVDIGWNDIGSWSSLYDISKKDTNDNALIGDVEVINTTNSYIFSENQLVTTAGIHNLVVVATKDSILVTSKESSGDIKEIASLLKNHSRPELDLHREVYRPWGRYDSIDQGDSFQVKRITVKPGEKLSVQMHHHRSEHWVVVSGVARVHYGDKFHDLNINESTYHDKEVMHALENPGKEILILIEVQIGDYLGEDDIVRYEDKYNRNKEQ